MVKFHQKMTNERFSKTENAILSALFTNPEMLSVRAIMHHAKISRATLYRHHQNVYEVIPDVERYLLRKYDQIMRSLLRKKDMSISNFYMQMLVFITSNRRYFALVVKWRGAHIIEDMVARLIPRIVADYKLPPNSKKMMLVYLKETSGLIEIWLRKGCRSSKASLLTDIKYLTRSMRSRLVGLLDEPTPSRRSSTASKCHPKSN